MKFQKRDLAVAVAMLIIAGVIAINFTTLENAFFGDKGIKMSSQEASIFEARETSVRGLTPAIVVDNYMKSLIGESDVATFVYAVDSYNTDSGDPIYHIIDGYKITSQDISPSRASFKVSYTIIADRGPDGRVTSVNKKSSAEFKLTKKDGIWLITEGLIGRYIREGKPGAQIFVQTLFYFDKDEPVEVALSQVIDPISPQNAYYKILRHLFYSPELKPKKFKTYIPQNSILLGVSRYGNYLHINVDENFDKGLKSDGDFEKAIAQIVRTANAIENIEGSKLFLEGKPYLRITNIGLDPDEFIRVDELTHKAKMPSWSGLGLLATPDTSATRDPSPTPSSSSDILR